MSDKLYKDNSIPGEYSIVGYSGNDFLFFKENDYSQCYIQKYIQGRYIVDYIYTPTDFMLISTTYELSDDWVYRQDVSHIFIIFFGILFLLLFGVNIVTRVVHRKGLL